MPKRLLKYKDYDVHSVTTVTADGRCNANIATWVMQTSMGGTHLVVALYLADYTIELVRESGILNITLLATDQTNLIRKLGQQSGRNKDKFKNLAHALDERGCPYLTDGIGYVQCRVVGQTNAGDHDLFVCEVIKQVVLNPEKTVMTNAFIKEKKLVRG